MDSKQLKKMFGTNAKLNGFSEAFGGWYKESEECTFVIELQKSSFGNNFYLNIKVFIQELFGTRYTLGKEIIKSPMGDITKQIRDLEGLDLENSIDNVKRSKEFNDLFFDVINPFVDKTWSKSKIRRSFLDGDLILLSSVRDKLFLN